MFKVHVDLHLQYLPPMIESGPGIIVTREVQLPFPAFDGLRIFSENFDDCPEPMGFPLKEVVWDIDCEVFLAQTSLVSVDLPIACIADDIRDWLSRGWRIGSFSDNYPQPHLEDEEPEEASPTDDVDVEQLHTLAPRRRPSEFNALMKALVRHMAENLSNVGVAYAMDRTGRFFTDKDLKDRPDDPAIVRWRDARSRGTQFSTDELFEWRDRVMRYKGIEKVITRR